MPSNKPRGYETWSPERQQAWLEMEQMRKEMEAEDAAANKNRKVPTGPSNAERRRMERETQKLPAAPAPKPSGPSIPRAVDIIQKRQQMLQGLKKGGPVKKKPVAKKAPAKKPAAKGVAKRGMGRAMRGR